MRRVICIIMVLSLILLLFPSCSKATKNGNETVINPKQTDVKVDDDVNSPKFAIYMVKEPFDVELDSKNLEKFVLQKEPIITGKDIISYNWNVSYNKSYGDAKNISSFTLKNGITVCGRMKEQGYKGAGMYPFVVTVDNNRIYVGEFGSVITSVGISKYIYVYSSIPLSKENINLVQLQDRSNIDLIHDKRIYNVFKNLGILKE